MIPISIVTTSLNQGRFLDDALISVQSQSYRVLEHIVVDGSSTDGTQELLKRKGGPAWQHLLWSSEPDQGQSQAMNKGLRAARGEVIGWLNSDDRYRPQCLQTIARVFEANPQIDVLYGDYTFIDEHGRHLRTRREIEFSPLVLFYHRVSFVPTTSCFFRRRIFDDQNWLNETLQYAMDHEFFMRLARRGYRFQHVRALLADFRIHAASKSSMMPQQQLKEATLAMLQHAPAARLLHNVVARGACLAALRILAATARCGEKALRGYYFPERFLFSSRQMT